MALLARALSPTSISSLHTTYRFSSARIAWTAFSRRPAQLKHDSPTSCCALHTLYFTPGERLFSSEPIPDDDEDANNNAHKWMTRGRQEQWNKMFAELLSFKDEHGDCNVPTDYADNPQLSKWVDTQRTQHRLFQEDKKTNMNLERMSKLEDEGFVWDIHAVKWEERLEEYKAYTSEHGHGSFPQSNVGLAAWIKKQRYDYKLLREDLSRTGHSPMTQERMKKLNELQFVWDSHEAAWNEKFAQLQQYRANNGDCLVPISYPKLGKWVDEQRFQWKKRKAGKHSHMTDQRIELLESEGFAWDALEAVWSARYDDLEEFVQLNGHCRVPYKYKQNQPLASWIRYQYKLYKKNLAGERTTLTPERIERLNKVGFFGRSVP